MRIATVNVNGVRAALTKGMGAWLEGAQADVVCLQEVRAPDDVVAAAFGGWQVLHQACEVKGRAGVAILSRRQLTAPVVGLPGVDVTDPAHTGRWVEATVTGPAGPVRVVSVYVHSGTVDTPKMDQKYHFLDVMSARLDALAAEHTHVVVMGDINIAHTPRDLKNWKGNLKTAGFLPTERAYLDRWAEAGWVDVHRALVGEQDGPYTWWSQRGRAFDTDTGWRLDYQWANPALAQAATAARVDKADAWDARWSDHAPLVIDYAL